MLEQARACHDEGVAVAVFPELSLSGYAIDDLLLQDTLLDGVLAAIDAIVEGSADLLPVIVVGAPLVHGTRVVNCAVVDPPRAACSAWRRSPTCRPTASSTSAAGSRRATTAAARRSASAAATCRSAPT